MDKASQTAPRFSQPVRQILSMVVVLALVAAAAWIGFAELEAVVLTSLYLNGAILLVFALGVLFCFRQVWQLMNAVSWIEGFARQQPGEALRPAPSLLAPLAALLRTRGARMQLTSTSTRSILDSVATRIDEDQDITRYLGNVLIFLGLLGTFYGLATTVPSLVATIQSLSPEAGESGADLLSRLLGGLESQLGGMGTAFSSSLLGLAGSLVIGLLELFAGHGQNRFYRELEEWLAGFTRVGFAGGEEGPASEASILTQVIDNLAEQMESLQLMFTQSDIARTQTDRRLGDLVGAIGRLSERLEQSDQAPALSRVAEAQERLLARLEQAAQDGPIDAESRMRLRSMDVQLLRILEEISAGRQEATAEIRADLGQIARALRGARAPGRDDGPVGGGR